MKPWFLAFSLPRLGRVQASAGMVLMREPSEGDLKSCDVIDEQINPCG